MTNQTSIARDPTSPKIAPKLPDNCTAVTIISDCIRLAANYWVPPNAKPDSDYPTILLIHGWGGVKAHLNENYAPHFAKAGYNVLTFDFRGWGESDGQLLAAGEVSRGSNPREPFTTEVIELRDIVDPEVEYRDVIACIRWLRGQAGVDQSRLVLWGSSLGGALALQAAIDHPEFGYLITQIANSNPRANWDKMGEDEPLGSNGIRTWQAAIARAEAPPFPGPKSKLKDLRGFPHYPTLVPFDPMEGIERLKAEVLVIDAQDEELFDNKKNGRKLFEAANFRGRGTYHAFPGQHYDLYYAESYQSCLDTQLSWLNERFG